MKKKNGLLTCEYCKRPQLLINFDDDFISKGKETEHQGPKTYPNVEKWCKGSCFPVVWGMLLELDSLEKFIVDCRSPKVKKFALYMLKRLRKIAKEQDRGLHQMAKDLS